MGITFAPVKLGFIPANRGFFSSELAAQMRDQSIKAMDAMYSSSVFLLPGNP